MNRTVTIGYINVDNLEEALADLDIQDKSECQGKITGAIVKWAEKFLQENKIAQPTGRYGMSCFCTYPEYRFDLSKLKDYENESGSQDKENEDEM